jgi:hypothetical protein
VFFRSLSDRARAAATDKPVNQDLLHKPAVHRAWGKRIKEGLTLCKCNDDCIWWSSKSTWSFFMSQENETDKCVTGNSALTEAELAELVASSVTRTFPTFDAFANFLLDLLIDDFGTAEARWVYCSEELAGSFIHYYDSPNDVHAMALRNLICFRKAQSAAFIANLFKDFFQPALPHSAADSAVGHDSAEAAP